MTIKEQEALRLVREAAHEAAAAGGLPAFLAELERARSEALLAAVAPPTANVSAPDRQALLTAVQVAARLGQSKWWVYANKDTLPIVRFPTGGFRFDGAKLEAWIKRRSG